MRRPTVTPRETAVVDTANRVYIYSWTKLRDAFNAVGQGVAPRGAGMPPILRKPHNLTSGQSLNNQTRLNLVWAILSCDEGDRDAIRAAAAIQDQKPIRLPIQSKQITFDIENIKTNIRFFAELYKGKGLAQIRMLRGLRMSFGYMSQNV